MLLLTWDEALVPAEGSEVVCGTAPLAKSVKKDAAGIAFHKKCLASVGHTDADGEGTSKGDKSETDTEGATRNGIVHEEKITDGVRFQSSNSRRSGKKPKDKEEKKKDLYGLLGIKDLRWMATQQDIKKAHQKQALKHHPDKTLQNVTDEVEQERLVEKFKKIQDAFETLSDPQKRREYDSVDDFDDSLPQTCRSADFYAVFGSAFRRQARWSSKTPIPDLGVEEETYESVQAFYDFWFSFKSWREFPHEDEEDPECAECREHKRWIERENTRLRSKAKKEETRRLREFVDRSYSLDPRVLARNAQIRAEKENKKQEKVRAQQDKEEVEKKAAEEVAAQKTVAEEAAKKVAAEAKRTKQNDQRELRRQRKRLRDMCAAAEAAENGSGSGDAERLLEADDVEELCRELPRTAIEELCTEVEGCEGGEDSKRTLLEAALSQVYESRGEEASKKQAAKMAAAAQERSKRKAALREKVAAAKDWSEEEVRMLDKALVKFPVGVQRRWEQVTQYVRTRTQEEIVFMVKIKQGVHASKFQQNDWRAGRKGGVGADVGIGANPDARDTAFTDIKVAASGDSSATTGPKAAAVSDTAASGGDKKVASENGSASKAPAATNGNHVTNGNSAPESDGKRVKGGAAKTPTDNGATAAPGLANAASAAKENKVENNTVWSKDQEMALLKALKAISKDVSDRWDKVADMVEGKDKLACARHFKEMKAQAKGTKS